jgi:hypothetical protein
MVLSFSHWKPKNSWAVRDWRFRTYDLSLVQIGNRHITRQCRLFTDIAAPMAPILFPLLPK